MTSIKFSQIFFIVITPWLSAGANGASIPLCGYAVSVQGSDRLEKITLQATSAYPLPRDTFGLSIFEIVDQDLIDSIENHSHLDWRSLDKENKPNFSRSIKSENIYICLEKFEGTKIRSSASFYLLVQKAFFFRVWKDGRILFSSDILSR